MKYMKYIHRLKDPDPIGCVFAPDERYFIFGDDAGRIHFLHLNTGDVVRSWEGHTNSIRALCVTRDGRFVISGSNDSTVKIWDFRTGVCLRTLQGHTGSVRSVAVDPRNRFIVSASDDKTVIVWDFKTAKVRHQLKGHEAAVNSVTIHPQGRYVVSAGSDATLRLWDIETGKQVGTYTLDAPRTIFSQDPGLVYVCVFSPDGNYLAAGDSYGPHVFRFILSAKEHRQGISP